MLHREGGQDRGKEGRGEEPVVVGGTGGGRGRRVSEEESSEVHMEGGTGRRGSGSVKIVKQMDAGSNKRAKEGPGRGVEERAVGKLRRGSGGGSVTKSKGVRRGGADVKIRVDWGKGNVKVVVKEVRGNGGVRGRGKRPMALAQGGREVEIQRRGEGQIKRDRR